MAKARDRNWRLRIRLPAAGGVPGYYIPKTGDKKFGVNLGLGLDYDINNFITAEFGFDYHRIFEGTRVYDPASEDAVQFLHVHGGVVLGF